MNKNTKKLNKFDNIFKFMEYVDERFLLDDDANITCVMTDDDNTQTVPQQKIYIMSDRAFSSLSQQMEIYKHHCKLADDIIADAISGNMAHGLRGLNPKRIVKSGNRTIVFWKDGTKTVVKRCEDEPDSEYSAFVAAFAKKYYGSNSRIRKVIKGITEYQKEKKGKEESDGSEG